VPAGDATPGSSKEERRKDLGPSPPAAATTPKSGSPSDKVSKRVIGVLIDCGLYDSVQDFDS
jgi:hypothetical protein